MRGTRTTWILGFAAVALLARPAAADTHRDEKLGYQISYPSKWQPMPLDTTKSVVQARFLCNQEYYWEANKGQEWGNHKPWLEVVVIPVVEGAGKGATVEKTDKGVKINRDFPYKDLKDYLDERCKSLGGFHFSAETETKINGLKVMQYEITVDKLVDGERLVYGWAYYTDDAIYGLVAEILRQEEKKLKPTITTALGSLKTFARTGNLPMTARTGDDIDVQDMVEKAEKKKNMTPEELEKERKAATARTLEKIKAGLPKDWSIVESKNYIAVSHADARYAKSLLQHAEALRDWFESNLGFFGSGYTGRVIIRICASSEESNAYRESRGWFTDTPEIVTYQDKSGWSDWAMESLNQQIYDQWLKDKNDDLRWAAPQWITRGIAEVVKNAKVKSGRIEFPADDWDKSQMRELARADKLLSADKFFDLASNEMFADWENGRQAGFFVKFLVTGAGSKHPKYKNVFADYMKNLLIHMQEKADAAGSEGAAPEAEPTNEAEEREQFRRRQQAWEKDERTTLARLKERTFEGWSERDWSSFDHLYRKDAK